MDIKSYLIQEGEQPLDIIKPHGGFASIFRTIGCIGDSLSSGEFESLNENNEKGYHDYYEYSWGQFMARALGSKVYNFSRGGMTGVEYVGSFADGNRFWDPKYACQAYIIALGVNDLINERSDVGSFEDLNNLNTFIGTYASIISRLQAMQPRAKFFLMTIPKENDGKDDIRLQHRDIIYKMAKLFKNTYILDFYQYGPVIDETFIEHFYMGHHLNPLGYQLFSELVMSYMDYIIRLNYQDFKEVGYIGTDLHYYKEKHD